MKILVAAVLAMCCAGQGFAQDSTVQQAGDQVQPPITAPAAAQMATPAAASTQATGLISPAVIVGVGVIVAVAVAVGVSGGNHKNNDHGTTGTTH